MTQPTEADIKDFAEALARRTGSPLAAVEAQVRAALDAPALTPEQMEDRALVARLNAKYRGARFLPKPVNRRVKR